MDLGIDAGRNGHDQTETGDQAAGDACTLPQHGHSPAAAAPMPHWPAGVTNLMNDVMALPLPLPQQSRRAASPCSACRPLVAALPAACRLPRGARFLSLPPSSSCRLPLPPCLPPLQQMLSTVCLDVKILQKVKLKNIVTLFVCMW